MKNESNNEECTVRYSFAMIFILFLLMVRPLPVAAFRLSPTIQRNKKSRTKPKIHRTSKQSHMCNIHIEHEQSHELVGTSQSKARKMQISFASIHFLLFNHKKFIEFDDVTILSYTNIYLPSWTWFKFSSMLFNGFSIRSSFSLSLISLSLCGCYLKNFHGLLRNFRSENCRSA